MAFPKLTARHNRWAIVGLCAASMALAYMDRAILPLFVEEIKADLKLSDFDFSLLTGLAFTMIYCLAGIPAGLLLDSKSRPKVLAVGMLVWSFATSLTGFGRSFAHVFLARVAVGIGESTVAPGSASMTADMFMGKKLARAMATISLGFVMGTGMAMIFGGGLAALFGHDSVTVLPLLGSFRAWQMVFLILGLPGLLLAPVLLLFVEDPPRRRVALDANGRRGKSNYLELLKFVWRHRVTVAFNLGGYISISLAIAAVNAWMPAHMLRVFHVSVSKVGVTLGLCQIVASVISVMFGAYWIDRKLESGQSDGAMQLSRNAILIALVPLVAFSFMPTFVLSVATVVIAQTLISLAYSVASVSHGTLAPNQVRAQFTATFLLLASLIGGATGPTAVALLNGSLFHDPQRIGTAAAIVGAGALLVAATLLTLGLKHYRKSIDIVVGSTTDDP